MKLANLNPHIRFANTIHSHLNLPHNSICYDCRIFFIEKGTGYIVISDIKYNFSNGDAIFLPPKTKYRLHFNTVKDLSVAVFNFDLTDDFSHITDSLGTACESEFVPERAPEYTPCDPFKTAIIKSLPHLKSTFLECIDICFKKPVFYKERASAILKLCLLEVGQSKVVNTPHSKLIEQVFSYVQENYALPSLSNEEVAQAFSYHPYHLSRIIKSETGKTLHQYITAYRLRVAKNLLVTTDLDIKDISWRCGFASAAYFIKTFRSASGITPKKYRQVNFHTEF